MPTMNYPPTTHVLQESQQALMEQYPSWLPAELVPAVALLVGITFQLLRKVIITCFNYRGRVNGKLIRTLKISFRMACGKLAIADLR